MCRDKFAKVQARLVLDLARAALLKTQEMLQQMRKERVQHHKRTRAFRLRKELRLLKSILLADPDCPALGAGPAQSRETSAPRRRTPAPRRSKTRKARAPAPLEADPAAR